LRSVTITAVLSLTVTLGLGSAGAAFAECAANDAEAVKWLNRMSHSLRETSYRGVFTWHHGGTVQTMRISHSVRGNMESEQITRLTGTSARVVRTEHPLDCIHPGHRLVRIGRHYTGSGEDCGVAAYYRLQMAGSSRVAGREAVVMNVLPRDNYRYGYRLALDRETGLLLKTQTVARDGQVLEQFQFADVHIGDVEDGGMRVEVVHEAAHVHGSPRPPGAEGTVRWTVRWLPDGFMMTDDVEGTSYNRTYTDGLASFSVFVEPVAGLRQEGSGQAREGGTTAYTQGLLISGKPALVTVLGEVPVNTARRVADSIAWVEPAGR
jgi:sigma-E factor negative regulatory protein RseB